MHRLLSQKLMTKALFTPVNLLVALGCISLVGLTACSDSNQPTTSQSTPSNQTATKTADKEPTKDSPLRQPKPH